MRERTERSQDNSLVITAALVAGGVFVLFALLGVIAYSVITSELKDAQHVEAIAPIAHTETAAQPSDQVQAATATPTNEPAPEVVEPTQPSTPAASSPSWTDIMTAADIATADQPTAAALLFNGSSWNLQSCHCSEMAMHISDPVQRAANVHFYVITHYGSWDAALAQSAQGSW